MRVLFTVAGWTGHYYCMVPLGWALRSAGHEVRVACPPELADSVARSGLTPVPLLRGPDLMSLARFSHLLKSAEDRRVLPGLPLPLHPLTGRPLNDLADVDVRAVGAALWEDLAAAHRASADAAVALARAWRPDLVCYSLMSQEGPLAARAAGVPAVFACPGYFGAAERGTELDLGPDDPTGSFVRHGLRPWQREQTEYVIDPTPRRPALAHGDATVLPVAYVPYNGPATAPPPWAREPARGRRVCLVWGKSAPAIFGGDVPALRAAVRAVADAGAHLAVTAPPEQVAALGDLPEGTLVAPGLPFQLLLEDCAAVIHHGSACTLMTAAVAGVPQLVLPLSDDAIETARRGTASGTSVSVPALTATGEQIRHAVHTVLSPPLRTAAQALRDDLLARPAPAALVPRLEAVAAR
ncbi:nucleotide disphospho-sugar-binding domain-containing protein [Streptomyces sp. NPDC006193]|uniref:nucleotide disphospho-sugar-binding domain-containing protein n=1 Tax=Streptomyces sp. NPDC006193 TaxID=3155717 RepID=UPI0033BD9951